MASNIQFKRGTAAALYALNPVLLRGEPGLEVDTNKIKYGNGVTAWRDLPYANPALEVVDGGEFTAGPVPPVPGTFSPPTIEGLTLWLDADNSDYVHRVNSRVSLWEDASESDAKLVQSNNGNRPAVENQIAAQDVVTFDGNNDAMIGKLALPEEFTLIVALRRRGASADGKVVTAYTANNSIELVLCGTETGNEFGVWFDDEYLALQPVDNLVPVVYTLQFSLAGLSTRLNGLNAQAAEGFTVPPLTHIALGGSRVDFATGNYSGDIAEVVLYDSVLSSADLIDAENYMMERWGVVAVTHPLRDGMKAFWPLNEESGDRLDITAAEVPLTPTGTVGFAPGVIENAAEFTGGNNYLQAPSDFALDGSFAISAWFKAASMAGGRSVLVQNWAAGNASGQVELGFGDDGFDTNAVFGRIATDDDIYTVVVPDLEANLWHHVVLVYSATANTLTLYLNGLQAAQVATLGSFGAGNIPLRVGIGDQTATQNDLACVVDQLGIWDRALSLQDVQMLYNYELGKEDFTADLYGDNVSLLLHMDKPANAAAGTGGGVGDPYFNDVSLLLRMNGADGSTTFTDSGSNALTVTANGNAQISTAQSRFGGASLYLPVKGDYLSVQSSEGFNFGDGDFTIEFWLYLENTSDGGVIVYTNTPSFTGWGVWIRRENDTWYMTFDVPGVFGDSAPISMTTGAWHHFAFVRQGNQLLRFNDGTQVSTIVFGYTVSGGPDEILVGYPASVAGPTGYIDDLRITKGVARYTANFTPPTAEFPDQADQLLLDPDFDKVSLLLKMDGANGSATFTDSGPNALTVTANGNAAISTAQSRFGGASLLFPGNGGNLAVTHDPALDFGNGDFTLEFWYYPLGSGSGRIGGLSCDGGNPWNLYVYSNGNIAWGRNCVGDDLTVPSGLVTNQWQHIAVARSVGVVRIFVDGALKGSDTLTIAYDNFGGLTVGPPPAEFSNFGDTFNGYIDDLRITKGVARYTANFTPPTASFPLGYTKVVTMPSVETSLLLHMDGPDGSTTFTDSGSNARTVTATGGAVISTAQSKFGGASGYFVGTPASGSSKLSIPTDTNFGTDDFTVEAWIWIDENTAAAGWSDGPCIVELGSHSQLGEDGIIFMTGLRSGNWIAWAWCFPAGGPIPETSNSITPGEWTHVAWTRQGNVFRIFIDGIKGTEYTSSASIPASDNSIQIGGSLNGATPNAFGGYIDEVRVIKGQALYTANFTPPTLPHPNPPVSPSLLLHFDGPDGSTTFTDHGKNQLTVTAEGDAVISTAQSKFGGASGYFSGGTATLEYTSVLDLKDGDWTVETWWRAEDDSGDHTLFAVGTNNAGGAQVRVSAYPTASAFRLLCDGGFGWIDTTLAGTYSIGQWYHVAATRAGNTFTLFIDGVQILSFSYGGSLAAYTGVTAIGFDGDLGGAFASYMNGYIDEFRIVKGQALYTANFTPPTESFATTSTPAPDLLLHFDGTDGSTTFTDHGKNQLAVTANGNAAISTTQSKFGGSSVYFGGAGNGLTVEESSAVRIGSADFTIEFWVYNSGTGQHFIGRHITGVGANWLIGIVGGNLYWEPGSAGTATFSSQPVPSNEWVHIAVTRSSGECKSFINGVLVATGNAAGSLDDSILCPLTVGADSTFTNAMTGYIDELRIIKGTALYTENFNPPAAPFLNPTITLIPPPGVDPYINNVFMLFHFDGADGSDVFTDSSTNALTATPNYDVQISTTESKFGGASLQVVHTPGNYLDVPCDFNLASDSWTLECWVNAAPTCCDASFNILTTNNNQYPNRFTIDFIVNDGSIYPRILTENNVVHSTSMYPADNSNLMPIPTHAPYVPGTWAHLAFVNNAETNNFSMYVDGVRVFSRVAIPPMVQREAVQIGRQYDNNFDGFDGTNYYLDDLRLTVGVARYTDNFTPPTAAFPDAAGGGGDGGDGPITTFIDTSRHNHEVTATGSAYLNLEDIKYGNASGEFAGGHCEIAMSPEFAFDDGDFTVEFWGKLSYVQYSAVFSTAATSQEAGTYLIGFSNDTNMFGFCYDMDNFTFVSANIAEYYNTWTHYAFVRASGVLKMYINGAEVATANASSNLDGGTQTTAVIGRRWTNEDDYYLDGLIDDLRITKGVARYIAEFNPPAKAFPDPAIPEAPPVAGDPYAEHVTLLLHMDGADGSTVFTDNSYLQNAVTAEGGAVISTEQSKFGGASLYQSVSGSYLSVPYNDGFSFDGDFTMEAWVNPSSVADGMAIVGVYGNGSYPFLISLVPQVRFWWNESSYITSTSNIQPNQWYHVAVSRNAGVLRLFVNGAQEASANDSAVIESTTNEPLTIGRYSFGGDGSTWFGYIDELRITKGVARYTADFTPPAVPFPSPFVPGPTAALLMHFDGADGSTTFTDSSVNALTVTANGSAAISTAQSKFGGASGYFDGNGDYISVNNSSQNSAFYFGSDDFTVEAWVYIPAIIPSVQIICAKVLAAASQADASIQMYLSPDNGGSLVAQLGLTTGVTANVTGTIPGQYVGEWHHVAMVRKNNVLAIYWDGEQIASAPVTDAANDAAAGILTIGAQALNGGGAELYFSGYIDELRVVKGTAVYTANFTPPTAPFSPTADVKPTDVTGCDLWLDSTGDIGEVNGSIVTWADKSGNGRTATPADYAPAPFVAVGEGPKGQNVVRFSGDPNVLDVGYQFNLKNSSGFVVVGRTAEDCSTSRPERILSFQPANGFDWQQNDAMVFHHNQNSGGSGLHNVNLYSNGTYMAHSIGCPMAWTVFSYVIDGAGNVRFRRNGVDEETATFSSLANKAGAELLLGFGGDFTQQSALRGDIAEVVIFDHALGEAALIGLERGLLARCLPPPTDTVLLLHMDGADGSTTFTDSSVNALTVTANGDAAISTAQSKFGGSSLFMSRGGGGYLSMPYSSALDFGTGDFTVEWWMRLSNTSDTGLFGGATQCGTWSVTCATEVRMAVGCANWDLSSSGWVCPVEQWVHIAVARHSGTLRFFADGVEIASAPNSVSYVLNPADMFTIGTPNSTYTVEGYIDELRVVKGTAVYTANFTPPTAPFNS